MKTSLLTARPLWHHGLVIIRIFTAVMIIYFGMEIFYPSDMENHFAFLRDIHFPLAVPMAYVAKVCELIGGLLLLVGLFTRIAVVPLMIIMWVIIIGMGKGNIFQMSGPFLFFLLFLNFFFLGGGNWSLDNRLFKRTQDQGPRHAHKIKEYSL